MASDPIAARLAPLKRAIANMVSRAVVKLVDDSKKQQLLQLQLLSGEVRDDVEHLQPYGFTSVPVEGAEGAVICVEGFRAHPLAIVIGDRRYRIVGLAGGEVAVYDKTGSKIVMKASGDIEITPSSGTVKLTGDLNVSGDVVGHAGTIAPISLTGHSHTVTGAVSTAPGAVTFAPVGKTGGPS